MPFDLGPLSAIWMAVAILGAAFVRGYSGFGFSAIVVAAAAVVTDPRQMVPALLVAEILLSVQQARSIRSHVDWPRALALFAGCLVGVPAGVWLLARLSPDAARIAISVMILAACGALLAGWRFERPARRPAELAVGAVSGIANGAAIGGLPVAAFFAAQPIPASAFRATLVAYFTLLDLWTLPVMARAGLISRETFVAVIVVLPLTMSGVWLGSRQFHAAPPEEFRRFAILLLVALAILGIIRSLV